MNRQHPDRPAPGPVALHADSFRAGREQGALNKRLWERREVRLAAGGGRHRPDVAGVFAVAVPDPTRGLQRPESTVASEVASAGFPRLPSPDSSEAAVRDADRVEVEVVG